MMKNRLVALIMVLAVCSAVVQGTYASFSDTEVSRENFVETGDMDLKVSKADDNWNGTDFRDDPPWGAGVLPAFNIPDAEYGHTYETRYLLWNCGSVDGNALLRLLIDEIPPGMTETSIMTIWYDKNGDLLEDGSEAITGSLATLALYPVDLGALPGFQVRRLKLAVNPILTDSEGLPVYAPYSLRFMTEFQLVQAFGNCYSDTETSSSEIAAVFSEDIGGTPGFWKNRAIDEYGGGLVGKQTIAGWFGAAVTNSKWFTDIPVNGDIEHDYNLLMLVLTENGENGYGSMVKKFRRQYICTLLNTLAAPPRLQLANSHNINNIDGAAWYFGYNNGTLAQIIASIESKETDGVIYRTPPYQNDMEVLKDICDALNNVEI